MRLEDIFNSIKGAELLGAIDISNINVSKIITDSRLEIKNSLFIPLVGDKFDGHDFIDKAISNGASAIIVSKKYKITKNFNLPVIVVPDTLIAYQEIAHWYRRSLKNLKVIGVTGSCGKTSTKEILKHLLISIYGENAVYATKANTNNHIGVPLNLLNLKSEHKVAVIEMGTNHHGEIEVLAKIAEPDIAVITSIANAHIEFFGDLNGVAKEKSNILKSYSKSKPLAIIPDSSPGNEILNNVAGDNSLTFGESPNSDIIIEYLGGTINGGRIKLSLGGKLKHLSNKIIETEWSLQGKYQAFNAGAALLAIFALSENLSKEWIDNVFEKVSQSIKNCKLTGMRMRKNEYNGVTVINDAYNANPDSMKATIEWLAEFANNNKSYIVLGDMLELGNKSVNLHQDIINFATEKLPNVNLFFVGENMVKAAKFANSINKNYFLTPIEAANSFINDLNKNDFIFLKASRGISLEVIENLLA